MLFNNTNKIIKNCDLLSIEYNPNQIIGREKEIKDIAFNLSYFFRDFPSLPKVILYGSTGTGKTTVMNYVLDEFKQAVKKENRNVKIIKIKGSDSRTKYEIMRQMLFQIDNSIVIGKNASEVRDKLIDKLQEKGLNILIFIDEIHCVNDGELNNILYFISRLGEDLNYYKNTSKILTEKKNSMVGYILVSNEMKLINKEEIKENTKSSITKERIVFSRYTPDEIYEILKGRINDGALYEDKIDEPALRKISALSVKEGEDSRYAILLLSKVCRFAEERGMQKITSDVVNDVNEELKKNLLIELIREYPPLHLNILSIIYKLNKSKIPITSKSIYEIYTNNSGGTPVHFSRISQIVTVFEKDSIVYITSKRNNRVLSIKETEQELYEVLTEKGYI